MITSRSSFFFYLEWVITQLEVYESLINLECNISSPSHNVITCIFLFFSKCIWLDVRVPTMNKLRGKYDCSRTLAHTRNFIISPFWKSDVTPNADTCAESSTNTFLIFTRCLHHLLAIITSILIPPNPHALHPPPPSTFPQPSSPVHPGV